MADDVRDWLGGIGLGQYADAFEENAIEWELLTELDHDVLKDVGVIAAGHRLRILKATRVLGGEEAPAVASTAPSEPTSPAQTAPSGKAERRPLTVMFCDLADSTELSTKLDPEDLQDIIRSYQETCTHHIQEYEGYVAKYMGDGILVYFGYPKALERNAERAVHSALDIVQAMAELNRTQGKEKGIEIAVRVGIATGTVMVGEIVGEGMAQERTVIGEAPNMAARLQGLAGRNGIVVGSLTRELTGATFDYDDLGLHELKGLSDPAQCWGPAPGSRHAGD